MQKGVDIYHIANVAGVSKSTVSRVLNGHSGVSAKTRIRVEQAIKDCAYIPNNSARSLSSFSTQAVVLAVSGITNPFFSQIISFILEKMHSSYNVILHSCEPGFGANVTDVAVSICKEKRPKGIILLGGNFDQNPDMLRLIDVPIVMVTTTIHSIDDCSWFSGVTIDEEKEGYKMANFICQNGHRNIAIIGEHSARESGIKSALKQYGVTATEVESEYERAYSFLGGYKVAKKLLATGKHTCFLCLSDVLAIGAMKAAQEAGLQVPRDISIVGFDGIENSLYTNPVLTTFSQPHEEIAEKSVSTLLGLINDSAPHKHFTVQTTLQKGGSFRAI